MTASKYQNLTDEQLVLQYKQAQDGQVFHEIYSRYYKKVFYTCLGTVKDQEAASDLSQDTMLKVMQNLASLQNGFLLGFWINRIAKNLSIDYCKKRKKSSTELIDDRHDLAYDEFDMESAIEHQSQIDKLETVIGGLNQEAQVFINLKYFENKSVGELQNRFGMSESAVKMRLARARKKMAYLYTDRLRAAKIA